LKPALPPCAQKDKHKASEGAGSAARWVGESPSAFQDLQAIKQHQLLLGISVRF